MNVKRKIKFLHRLRVSSTVVPISYINEMERYLSGTKCLGVFGDMLFSIHHGESNKVREFIGIKSPCEIMLLYSLMERKYGICKILIESSKKYSTDICLYLIQNSIFSLFDQYLDKFSEDISVCDWKLMIKNSKGNFTCLRSILKYEIPFSFCLIESLYDDNFYELFKKAYTVDFRSLLIQYVKNRECNEKELIRIVLVDPIILCSLNEVLQTKCWSYWIERYYMCGELVFYVIERMSPELRFDSFVKLYDLCLKYNVIFILKSFEPDLCEYMNMIED